MMNVIENMPVLELIYKTKLNIFVDADEKYKTASTFPEKYAQTTFCKWLLGMCVTKVAFDLFTQKNVRKKKTQNCRLLCNLRFYGFRGWFNRLF